MAMTGNKQKPPRHGKAKVLIVDDHPTLRYGLAQLINQEPDLTMCGEAEDVREAFEAIEEKKPDIVLADISLKTRNGLQLIKELKEKHAGLPVLVLTMHDESVYAERALRAGARGYIMKQEATGKVTDGIRKVLSGDLFVSDRMAQKMMEGFIDDPSRTDESPLTRLTDREMEVLRLTGQGLGTREIAESLNLSRKTIESHYAKIKGKLNLSSAKELFQYALEWKHYTSGSITPPWTRTS
jgi:DNA-binding NarL/FixJ family response regulator